MYVEDLHALECRIKQNICVSNPTMHTETSLWLQKKLETQALPDTFCLSSDRKVNRIKMKWETVFCFSQHFNSDMFKPLEYTINFQGLDFEHYILYNLPLPQQY